MTPQNLEDLLKVKTFWFPDTTDLQELVDRAIADLRSEGKKMVVIKMFADNTIWIGKKVRVLDQNDLPKEIAVQFLPLKSVYQLTFEYYDPAEVSEF